jgi:hypothetical protein
MIAQALRQIRVGDELAPEGDQIGAPGFEPGFRRCYRQSLRPSLAEPRVPLGLVEVPFAANYHSNRGLHPRIEVPLYGVDGRISSQTTGSSLVQRGTGAPGHELTLTSGSYMETC